MRKLFPWLRSHPFISIFGGFLALLVAAHFFLNWRAERRWQAYAEAARARGVKLHLTDFERPEILDEENFAALPMMRAIMQPGATSPMALPEKDRPSFGDPRKGERLDWVKWQAFFKDAGFISETTDSRPLDVLSALEHYAPQFQEWSEWKTRTRCQFALDLKAGAAMPLPHLNIFIDATKLFQLRLRAHLALGDSRAAYEDFRQCFQSYRALVEEPTLICALVKITCLRLAISAVGDGLGDHLWTDTELQKIATDFTTARVWNDYTSAFASERGFGNSIEEEHIAMTPWSRAKVIGAIKGLPGLSGPSIAPSLALFIPDRMFRDNQLRANHHIDELLNRVNADGTKYDPDAQTLSDDDHLQGFDTIWFALFKMSAPVFSTMGGQFAFVQTQLDMASLGIAIERFRLARGAIPETLAELVPEFIPQLPRDVYSDAPMIYRPRENGQFLLYSVGPDRRDDGGAIDPKMFESRQPDWVWSYSQMGSKIRSAE